MALGYLDDSKLYAIASAIRSKTSKSATMTVDEMPDEIESITTGAQVEPLNVAANGTYSAPTGYAYSPVTVNVSGGGGITVDDIAERNISGSIYCEAREVGAYAFYGCSMLSTATLPSVSQINNQAFRLCRRLTEFHLESVSSVPVLGTSVFASTPIGGYSKTAGQYGSVYVPASLYNSFLTATNWSSISNRIVSVP